jgi:hypothetical protein
MSSPPQGRALALPFIRAGKLEHSVKIAETQEFRAPSDEQAMARVQAEDAAALNLLFDRYSRLVLGIALRILRDYGEAEEIVQETFFYIYRKAALFDGDGKGLDCPDRLPPRAGPEGAFSPQGLLPWYRHQSAA